MSVVLATSGFDKTIRFWDAPSGRCQAMLRFIDSHVNRLEISGDKKLLAAAGYPIIKIYDIATLGEARLTLSEHTSNVTAVGFSVTGQYLYSASEDGSLKVWDLRSTACIQSWNVGSAVNCAALRSDKDQFWTGDAGGFVKQWDLRSPTEVVSARQPEWDSLSASDTSSAPHHPSRHIGISPIQAVDISEDSRTLVAVTNHGTVFVWDPSTSIRFVTQFNSNEIPGTYSLHGKIAPNCRHLVTTASDGTAKLWDTTTWQQSSTLQAGAQWVWDAAFCADSGYLVTASSDRVARLFNLDTATVVEFYSGHESAVTCVALNDCSE